MTNTTAILAQRSATLDLNSELERYRKELADRTQQAANTLRTPQLETKVSYQEQNKVKAYQNALTSRYSTRTRSEVSFNQNNLYLIDRIMDKTQELTEYDQEVLNSQLEKRESIKGLILDAKL
jgi:hypothetical protein